MQASDPDRAAMEQHHSALQSLLNDWDKHDFNKSADILWSEKKLDQYRNWLSQPIQVIPNQNSDSHFDQNLFNAIIDRRSIRFWKPQSIPGELIERIINAGIHAPSAFNLQACKYIVILNKENMTAGDSSNKSLLQKAPVKIYITVDRKLYGEEYAPAMDSALSAQNMMLAAHALGLGCCLLYQGELIDQHEFRTRYHLQESCYCYCVLTLGYPACTPEMPGRIDIHDCMIIGPE